MLVPVIVGTAKSPAKFNVVVFKNGRKIFSENQGPIKSSVDKASGKVLAIESFLKDQNKLS